MCGHKWRQRKTSAMSIVLTDISKLKLYKFSAASGFNGTKCLYPEGSRPQMAEKVAIKVQQFDQVCYFVILFFHTEADGRKEILSITMVSLVFLTVQIKLK